MKKTVVNVDLAQSGKIMAALKRLLPEPGKAEQLLSEQITGFVHQALHNSNLKRTTVSDWKGDGGSLHIPNAKLAYDFATSLHAITAKYNGQPHSEQRHFRIGVATGNIAEQYRSEMCEVHTRATRLEQAAGNSGLLIDENTFVELPPELTNQHFFGPEHVGKDHEPRIKAWRYSEIPSSRSIASSDNLHMDNAEFLELFRAQRANGRSYCWILGSGVSEQSNLKLGRTLADEWLEEKFKRDLKRTPVDQQEVRHWAEKSFEDIGFKAEFAANYLPYIYYRCFADNPDDGCRAIESLLEDITPSIGYSILAYLMTETPHRIAFTTYIDNLIYEAIMMYARKSTKAPIVCGHESVLTYAHRSWRRPVIAKLQRDLFTAPKYDEQEITLLPTHWKDKLVTIFRQNTPIVIGYGDRGGGAGNLKSFFDLLPSIDGGFFWCYRHEPAHPLSEEVIKIARRLGGRLVPICGFDELMIEIWDILRQTSLKPDIEERAQKLARSYHEQLFALVSELAQRPRHNTEASNTTQSCAQNLLERLRRRT
jgi:hypothetical protein